MSLHWTSWHGPEVEARARAEAAKKVAGAAFVVMGRAKRLASVAGTSTDSKGKRTYGSSRSSPGQPPYKQRGTLWQSITVAVDPASISAKVGSPLMYALYLELGTSKMAPRPFLRRALRESLGDVRRILA